MTTKNKDEFLAYFQELERKTLELKECASKAGMYGGWGFEQCMQNKNETVQVLRRVTKTTFDIHCHLTEALLLIVDIAEHNKNK